MNDLTSTPVKRDNNIILDARSTRDKFALRTLHIGTPIAKSETANIHVALDCLGRTLAIKMPYNDKDPSEITRLKREYDASGEIAHPAVVKHIGIGQTDTGNWFVASEFINSKTLERHRHYKGGTLPTAECILLGYGVAFLLSVVQSRGLVYGNLHGDQILVCPDDSVKLLGLGSVRPKSAAPEGRHREKDTKKDARNLEYAAPETLSDKPPDFRTDVWQLGLLLHEMLTGEMPNRVSLKTLSWREFVDRRCDEQVDPDKSIFRNAPRLAPVIAKALRLDPEKRFANALEMQAAIREAFVDIPKRRDNLGPFAKAFQKT